MEKTLNIIVVDDEQIVLDSIKKLLKKANYEIHCVPSVEDALEKMKQVKIDIILTDLMMPDIDGLDLVPQYRQQESTRDTPLIVLSSREEPVTKAEAFARGANDYLVKLPDHVELVARIRYHSKGYISLLQRNAAFESIALSRKRLAEQMEAGAKYLQALLPAPMAEPIRLDPLL